MDDEFIKKHRKIVSSGYPPRSADNGYLGWEVRKIGTFLVFSSRD